MIARLFIAANRSSYVALHLDRRTSARDVWVTVRGDRGSWGEVTAMSAARLCVASLQEQLSSLVEASAQLRQSCERTASAYPFAEQQRMAAMASDFDAALARLAIEVARLIDEPAPEDEVDIDGTPLPARPGALDGW